MNRIFRFAATLTGALALVTGFTACSKDDDKKGGMEQCVYTYTDEDDVTTTYTYLEDGTYIKADNKGYYSKTNWSEDFDSWDEAKKYVTDNGGKCN